MYRILYHDHGIRENKDILFNVETEKEALEQLNIVSKGIVEIHLIQKITHKKSMSIRK